MMDCRNPEETIIRFYDENNKLSHIYVEHMNMVDLYNWKSLGSDLNLPSKKIINKDACVLFFGRKKVIVRRMEGDEPDPEKAFLQAYFLSHYSTAPACRIKQFLVWHSLINVIRYRWPFWKM